LLADSGTPPAAAAIQIAIQLHPNGASIRAVRTCGMQSTTMNSYVIGVHRPGWSPGATHYQQDVYSTGSLPLCSSSPFRGGGRGERSKLAAPEPLPLTRLPEAGRGNQTRAATSCPSVSAAPLYSSATAASKPYPDRGNLPAPAGSPSPWPPIRRRARTSSGTRRTSSPARRGRGSCGTPGPSRSRSP
jgi:hypothetical protein